jgi:hypothetical protein
MTKALVLLAVSLVSSGCDLTQPQPVTTVAVAKSAPVKPIVRLDQLEFSGLEIYKSSTFRTNGDQRPFYFVQGRIQNNSQYTVTGVRFFVQILAVGAKQDSAVLSLKTNILPGEPQTFQTIQLLPPPGKWNWQYEALSVEAENN